MLTRLVLSYDIMTMPHIYKLFAFCPSWMVEAILFVDYKSP